MSAPSSDRAGIRLLPTDNVHGIMAALPKRESHRIHYASPGPDRWRLRSKSFTGIANAMARQWGELK